jgi:uncharacterized repeat protein (TIGR01451 family)
VAAEQTSSFSTVVAAPFSGDRDSDLIVATTAPRTANTNEVIEFVIVVTNKGPASISGLSLQVWHPEGTSYISAESTSGRCGIETGGTCGPSSELRTRMTPAGVRSLSDRAGTAARKTGR